MDGMLSTHREGKRHFLVKCNMLLRRASSSLAGGTLALRQPVQEVEWLQAVRRDGDGQARNRVPCSCPSRAWRAWRACEAVRVSSFWCRGVCSQSVSCCYCSWSFNAPWPGSVALCCLYVLPGHQVASWSCPQRSQFTASTWRTWTIALIPRSSC